MCFFTQCIKAAERLAAVTFAARGVHEFKRGLHRSAGQLTTKHFKTHKLCGTSVVRLGLFLPAFLGTCFFMSLQTKYWAKRTF